MTDARSTLLVSIAAAVVAVVVSFPSSSRATTIDPLTWEQLADWRGGGGMSFRAKPPGIVTGPVGSGTLNLRADYLSVDQSASAGEFEDREELTLSLRSQLNENWSISGQQKRDLVDNRNRSVRLGFTYQDECLLFSTTASRTFFKDRDLEPEDTIFFQLVFKHLGGVSSN